MSLSHIVLILKLIVLSKNSFWSLVCRLIKFRNKDLIIIIYILLLLIVSSMSFDISCLDIFLILILIFVFQRLHWFNRWFFAAFSGTKIISFFLFWNSQKLIVVEHLFLRYVFWFIIANLSSPLLTFSILLIWSLVASMCLLLFHRTLNLLSWTHLKIVMFRRRILIIGFWSRFLARRFNRRLLWHWFLSWRKVTYIFWLIKTVR